MSCSMSLRIRQFPYGTQSCFAFIEIMRYSNMDSCKPLLSVKIANSVNTRDKTVVANEKIRSQRVLLTRVKSASTLSQPK